MQLPRPLTELTLSKEINKTWDSLARRFRGASTSTASALVKLQKFRKDPDLGMETFLMDFAEVIFEYENGTGGRYTDEEKKAQLYDAVRAATLAYNATGFGTQSLLAPAVLHFGYSPRIPNEKIDLLRESVEKCKMGMSSFQRMMVDDIANWNDQLKSTEEMRKMRFKKYQKIWEEKKALVKEMLTRKLSKIAKRAQVGSHCRIWRPPTPLGSDESGGARYSEEVFEILSTDGTTVCLKDLTSNSDAPRRENILNIKFI